MPAPGRPDYTPGSGASDRSKSRLSRDPPTTLPSFPIFSPPTLSHSLHQSEAATDPPQRPAGDYLS